MNAKKWWPRSSWACRDRSGLSDLYGKGWIWWAVQIPGRGRINAGDLGYVL